VNKRGADRRFEEADLRLLRAMASAAALALLNTRLAADLVDQERVRRELELAAEIQRRLLPERIPPPFPIAGVNIPAGLISGDFFDFLPLDDGRIAFCVGDVSGKGINASLLMAKAAGLYRCLVKAMPEPGRLLGALNREICETVTRGMFVTMVGGIYDLTTASVRMANAGHEPPLLQTEGARFEAFPAKAPPLGIDRDIVPGGVYPELRLSLDGGTLYVFTDGLTEGYTPTGAPLGVEGLKKLLAEAAALPAGDRIDRVMESVTLEPLHDDLTLLAVEGRTSRE
jgi:sigma-B regulation protein RsbU (phosphoserine phosphatase)